MIVAILGAPASGKSHLAQELARSRPELRVCDDPPLSADLAADHTLLMGLDLAPASPVQAQADAALRELLRVRGIAYGVVYGHGKQRLRNALRLLAPEAERPRRWNRACEKCSDPDCEHRLFTGLNRSTAAGPAPS